MTELPNAPRLRFEVSLRSAQGHRFQPTGFADLGAATYTRPGENGPVRMLLVETAQSVANRLEKEILDGEGPRLAPAFAGLPYVLAKLTGQTDTETSSLLEAHRLNSPFIVKNKQFEDDFKQRAEYAKGRPLNWRTIARAVFHYDPNSLLHGVFFANLEDGRIKIPRAITGFIEAENVNEVVSGGVKNNPIDPTGKIRAVNYDKNVYSNVPYSRTEFTAEKIDAYFNLDLAQLRGYGQDPAAYELLVYLALYKVRRFLASGLRLRTACDFTPTSDLVLTSPTDQAYTVPSESELLTRVQEGIQACASKGLFANPAVTELITPVKWVEKEAEKEKAQAATEEVDGEDN